MDSIWSTTSSLRERSRLPGDRETQVAVIGGGMAGILIAHTLQAAGLRVAVLEAGRIGSGQSQHTTAKVTAQHGMCYDRLIRKLGAQKARQYAQANLAACKALDDLITTRGIDCDWQRQNAYVYGDDPAALDREARAAALLGLPADRTDASSLPFPAAGAVRFSDQAQFHPLKFLGALADGLTVYEQTPVLRVERDHLVTPWGTVRADRIIFACHFPFVNIPGLYFARMYQERSYVLALEHTPPVDGMWISADGSGCSLRTWGTYLLLGGGHHRSGAHPGPSRYDWLRTQARTFFPKSPERACWSAQDCMTPDGVPYIGRYAAGRLNWYVATGFNKWGMTSSMAAALILRDLLCSGTSPWAQVFDPGRFGTTALRGVASQSGQAAVHLARYFFQIPSETASQLSPGQGGILFYQGKKLGGYRDLDGSLYLVDLRCPHLGCQLEWNPDERSWDCPCHGSRFDARGQLLSGPAQEGIVHEG